MSNEPELIDLGVVDELRDSVGGDEAFIKELVSTYLAESPGYLEAIVAAAAADDATALVRPRAARVETSTLRSANRRKAAMLVGSVMVNVYTGGRKKKL